ncbi:MAG: MarR family transcriptional regulator [Leptospiraceae bacterium]|nr:MarR family transcriptional regulator [Leptospiraceae bacterium]
MAQNNSDLFLTMGAVHRGTSDWVRTNLSGKGRHSVLSLSILKYLDENNGIAQGELGLVLRRDPMTMSQAIRALQGNGLITSQTDKEDKRIKRLSLTKKGASLAKSIKSTEDKFLAALTKKWGKTRVNKLVKDIEDMNLFLNEFLET